MSKISAKLGLGLRRLSTTSHLKVNLPRIVVEPSAAVKDVFKDPEFKGRKCPGHFKVKRVLLPPKLKEHAETMIKVNGLGDIAAGLELHNKLKNRKPPIEEEEYKAKAAAAEALIKGKHAHLDQFLSEKEKARQEHSDFSKIKRRLQRTVYHWQPMDYTKSLGYTYLVGRTPGEYASLYRIFFELAQRDPEFKPETLLDFGSGVGSVVWAANQFWKKSLKEHMCVDASDEMSNLAELLLRGGSQKFAMAYPGIYFRRLLPTTTHRKYDMTVASHSLLELSSLKERIEVIDILWKKTEKYMVLVEIGTNAGFRVREIPREAAEDLCKACLQNFQVLNEAREYILQLYDYEIEDEQTVLDFETGHMFMPCPHDSPCPRLQTDNTPCNFSIRHETLMPFASRKEAVETFSYLVFKKGHREDDDMSQWPRLVREPLLRPRHVVCRLCTKYGKISEAVITKGKSSRELYRSARTALWGDLLPVDEVEVRMDSVSQNSDLSHNSDSFDADADLDSGSSDVDAESDSESTSTPSPSDAKVK